MREILIAKPARVRLRLRMCLHVSHEHSLGRECFLADIASVRSFTAVRAFMVSQMVGSGYRFAAYIAHDLRRTLVTAHVTIIRLLVMQNGGTQLAHVLLPVDCVSGQMFLETIFRFDTFPAFIARETRNTMVNGVVIFQIAQSEENAITFIALIVTIFRMLCSVTNHGSFVRKEFIAKFTFVTWILLVTAVLMSFVAYPGLEMLSAVFASICGTRMVHFFMILCRILLFDIKCCYVKGTLFYIFDFHL